MEESLSLISLLKKEFQCGEVDLKTYSPLTLAFVGDCIYDLVVRTVLAERANCAADKLHKKKSALVKAETQAAMAEAVLPDLTEEETGYYRRGRNAHSYTVAKNASVGDYRKATGLEALFGYLYLADRMERMIELVKLGLLRIEKTL